MNSTTIRSISSLFAIATGSILVSGSLFMLLLAFGLSSSGGDVRFESSVILAFLLYMIGGMTGVFAGVLMIEKPRFAIFVFALASVIILIANLTEDDLGLWYHVPVLIFGAEALLSIDLDRRRANKGLDLDSG